MGGFGDIRKRLFSHPYHNVNNSQHDFCFISLLIQPLVPEILKKYELVLNRDIACIALKRTIAHPIIVIMKEWWQNCRRERNKVSYTIMRVYCWICSILIDYKVESCSHSEQACKYLFLLTGVDSVPESNKSYQSPQNIRN